MALDALVDSTQLDSDLTSVANAIRTKGGTSAQLAFPADFVSAIGNIPTGGGGYTEADFLDASKPTGAITGDATTYGTYRLYGRTGVTALNLPNATSIPNYFASNATNLASVSAPKATLIGTNSLEATPIQYAVFPKAMQINEKAFYKCSNLIAADFGGNATSTSAGGLYRGNIFNTCSNLSILVIRSTVRFYLYATNIFGSTPFASGGAGGTLYVPSALISAYQSATNWSTILGYANNQILPIEGSVYETQYVDGTPISS